MSMILSIDADVEMNINVIINISIETRGKDVTVNKLR